MKIGIRTPIYVLVLAVNRSKTDSTKVVKNTLNDATYLCYKDIYFTYF